MNRIIQIISSVLLLSALTAGCTGMTANQQRVLSGAAIGAAAGGAVSGLSGGSVGAGAVLGGAAGAVGGVIVNEMKR